jgi:hypothetical protein
MPLRPAAAPARGVAPMAVEMRSSTETPFGHMAAPFGLSASTLQNLDFVQDVKASARLPPRRRSGCDSWSAEAGWI